MMQREIVEPTTDATGDEIHPAWAMIGASRVSSSPPGAVLFDSDVTHQHYVVVRLATASRDRHLHHDWKRARQTIIEVAMSEAQWASFVSTMNVGDGVACTVQWREGVGRVPEMPYSPRLQESIREVRAAADMAAAKVARAAEAVQTAFDGNAGRKAMREALRDLQIALGHMPANTAFAAEALNEHAENVVQKARADIEAMVTAKAQQLGIDTSEVQLGIMAAPDDVNPIHAEPTETIRTPE